MTDLKIHALPLVRTDIVKGILTYLVNIAEPLSCYEYIWYIEGLKQRVLVDAGGPAESYTRRGYRATTIATPQEALGKLGFTPEDIDIVIVTHLHFDHIDYAHLYKNATFIVQKVELEGALNPHPMQAGSFPRETIRQTNFRVVEGETEVLEGVKVVLTPGHTVGGQSVVVETANGRATIPGLCTIRDNFDPPEHVRHRLPVIAAGTHIDVRASFESLLRIKEEADIIYPLHDATSPIVVEH